MKIAGKICHIFYLLTTQYRSGKYWENLFKQTFQEFLYL